MVNAEVKLDRLGDQTRVAVATVLFSGFLNSFGGLILRSVQDASEWQIVFFRAGSLMLALTAILLVKNPGQVRFTVRQIGFWGGVCGLLFCGMQTLFIFSLSHTTVANTTFVLSSAPILTAFMARLVLGEIIERGTWVVLTVAVFGTAAMVADGVSTGNALGDLAAVGSMLCFVGFIVTLRAKRNVDMLPSLIIGGLLASGISFVAAGGDVSVPIADLLLCLFWGGVLSSSVLVLFTFASRRLKGGVLTMLLTIEFFLAPFWVWLFMGEKPTILALFGGAIIFCGVAGQAYLSSRATRTARTP